MIKIESVYDRKLLQNMPTHCFISFAFENILGIRFRIFSIGDLLKTLKGSASCILIHKELIKQEFSKDKKRLSAMLDSSILNFCLPKNKNMLLNIKEKIILNSNFNTNETIKFSTSHST